MSVNSKKVVKTNKMNNVDFNNARFGYKQRVNQFQERQSRSNIS